MSADHHSNNLMPFWRQLSSRASSRSRREKLFTFSFRRSRNSNSLSDDHHSNKPVPLGRQVSSRASTRCLGEDPSISTPSQTPTAKVMHLDGTMQEYKRPVKAWQVTVGCSGCFLCDSDTMEVGSAAPVVPEDDELQMGELYFVLPLSAARQPLSLPDLCRLAITAFSALRSRHETPLLTAASPDPRWDPGIARPIPY